MSYWVRARDDLFVDIHEVAMVSLQFDTFFDKEYGYIWLKSGHVCRALHDEIRARMQGDPP